MLENLNTKLGVLHDTSAIFSKLVSSIEYFGTYFVISSNAGWSDVSSGNDRLGPLDLTHALIRNRLRSSPLSTYDMLTLFIF